MNTSEKNSLMIDSLLETIAYLKASNQSLETLLSEKESIISARESSIATYQVQLETLEQAAGALIDTLSVQESPKDSHSSTAQKLEELQQENEDLLAEVYKLQYQITSMGGFSPMNSNLEYQAPIPSHGMNSPSQDYPCLSFQNSSGTIDSERSSEGSQVFIAPDISEVVDPAFANTEPSAFMHEAVTLVKGENRFGSLAGIPLF